MIEKAIKQKFGTSKAYCESIGKDPTNHKRRLKKYIQKVNEWLEPLGLKAKITNK